MFHYGTTYHADFLTDKDLGEISHVKFRWTHGLDLLFHGKMSVDSLEVIRLTSGPLVGGKEVPVSPKFKFCNKNHEQIANKHDYEFNQAC